MAWAASQNSNSFAKASIALHIMKPRVLAITDDRQFIRALRVEMPLFNMKKQGLIDDYVISDRTLLNVPEDILFDVVWLQRVNTREIIDHLCEKLDCNYLYDIDDLLISKPVHVPSEQLSATAVVQRAVCCAKMVTVTSCRLARLLSDRMGEDIESKAMVCPNGSEFPAGIRTPQQPAGMICVTSGVMTLGHSADAVIRACNDFAMEYGLPIYCFGPPQAFDKFAKKTLVLCGTLPLWHYHQILSAFPAMIGLVPVETCGDAETLDFIKGKSDVKMVEFGGFGHPSVYSAAPPYLDTDIRAGIIVRNTYSDWLDALRTAYHDAWRRAGIEQREIVNIRNMDRIAKRHWYEAISQVRLKRPMRGIDVKRGLGTGLFCVDVLKHTMLSLNPQIKAQIRSRLPGRLYRWAKKFV
jgi:hypothetical protein